MNHVVRTVRLLTLTGMLFASSNAVAVMIGDVSTEDIAVAFTATPSEHLLPGQPIDFVLIVTNLGGLLLLLVRLWCGWRTSVGSR